MSLVTWASCSLPTQPVLLAATTLLVALGYLLSCPLWLGPPLPGHAKLPLF